MLSKKSKTRLIQITIIISILLVIIGVTGMFIAGSFSLKEDTLQFLEVFIGVVALIVGVWLSRSSEAEKGKLTSEPNRLGTVVKKNEQTVIGSNNITAQDITGSQVNIRNDKSE